MYKNLAMNVRTVNDAKITALVRNFLTVADNLLGFFNRCVLNEWHYCSHVQHEEARDTQTCER